MALFLLLDFYPTFLPNYSLLCKGILRLFLFENISFYSSGDGKCPKSFAFSQPTPTPSYPNEIVPPLLIFRYFELKPFEQNYLQTAISSSARWGDNTWICRSSCRRKTKNHIVSFANASMQQLRNLNLAKLICDSVQIVAMANFAVANFVETNCSWSDNAAGFGPPVKCIDIGTNVFGDRLFSSATGGWHSSVFKSLASKMPLAFRRLK